MVANVKILISSFFTVKINRSDTIFPPWAKFYDPHGPARMFFSNDLQKTPARIRPCGAEKGRHTALLQERKAMHCKNLNNFVAEL